MWLSFNLGTFSLILHTFCMYESEVIADVLQENVGRDFK